LPDLSDPRVIELTQQILARPEYAGAKSQFAPDSIIQKILNWLTNWDGLHSSSPVLYWTVVVLCGFAMLALIAHIVWTISIAMRAPAPEAHTTITGSPARDLAAEAAALAAGGRYLDAAHHMMIASFRALGERAVIELRPDRSNRWIRAALRDSRLGADLTSELDRLVAETEHRWFGARENDAAIYSAWRTAFERVSTAAR
jgi:hypothetical protein